MFFLKEIPPPTGVTRNNPRATMPSKWGILVSFSPVCRRRWNKGKGKILRDLLGAYSFILPRAQLPPASPSLVIPLHHLPLCRLWHGGLPRLQSLPLPAWWRGGLHPLASWRTLLSGQALVYKRCGPLQFLHLTTPCGVTSLNLASLNRAPVAGRRVALLVESANCNGGA